MESIKQTAIEYVLDQGWPEVWIEDMTITDDDLLDLGMLHSGMEWTGTRVVELIDHRHDDMNRKEWN